MIHKLDSHTHTLASGHAYNTIMEMAKAAVDQKLELLAVTDHAMAMPGTCHSFYFMNLRSLPAIRTMPGIRSILSWLYRQQKSIMYFWSLITAP